MPPHSPLTAPERKLCLVIVGAVLLIMAIPAVSFGADRAIAIPEAVLQWLSGEWRGLLAGQMPRLSMSNAASMLFTCTAVGALVLLPLHVAHLMRRARGLPAAALWFWTLIYAFFPALCGVVYLCLGIALLRSGYGSEREVFPFAIGWLVLGIVIAVVAFRAWRKRRREEKAARIMAEATA